MCPIFYKKRREYKYVLDAKYIYPVPPEPALDPVLIPVNQNIAFAQITLTMTGQLIINKGYAWDGPSDPAIDTPNFMRGSLVHDALYQLMREGCLDPSVCRDAADRLLQSICIASGMSKLRAWWVYTAVHLGAASSAASDRLIAP